MFARWAKRGVCSANGAKAQEMFAAELQRDAFAKRTALKAQEMCSAVPNIAYGERDACSRAAKRGVCFANVNNFALRQNDDK